MNAEQQSPAPSGWATELEGLRLMGADRLNPVQFRYIEALTSRAQSHQGRVRQSLDHKLAQAIGRLKTQCAALDQADTINTAPQRRSPLRALLDYIGQQGLAQESPDGNDANPTTELKTVRQFRSTWSKFSVDQQLSKDLELAPKNAGPINSHMLTLRALAAMRDISPDYLNRFVSYVDTLLFLEQNEQDKLMNTGKAPAAKRARKKASP